MKKSMGNKATFMPSPAVLIVSGDMEENNVFSVAWITLAGFNPPMLTFSYNKDRYSYELINKTGEFTVNIPSASMADKIDYCGLISGRKMDKITRLKLNIAKSQYIQTPILLDCPVNYECRMMDKMEIGGRIIVFAEILDIKIDEDKLTNDKADAEKIDPLLYLNNISQYRSIGKYAGSAFSIGKKYL